jgi:hypothetical protein
MMRDPGGIVILRCEHLRASKDDDGTGFAKTCFRAAECESGIMMDFCSIPSTHSVVPAKAGTHNHRRSLLCESRRTASLNTRAAAYGSLLSQGRRSGG